VTEQPDEAELERLGLYDPKAADAEDRLRSLRLLLELGGSVDEIAEAYSTARETDLALDLAMRPPGETQDLDAFVASSDLEPSMLRQLWSAFGLPASGPVPVTPDAAAALRLLVGMASWLNPESALALARVMGSSSTRLAEALISAFRVEIELPSLASGTTRSGQVEAIITAGRDLLPLFVEATNAVFRRHMALASYQLWSPDEERAAVTHERTVGFADLVGSTEAVRASSAAALAVTIREFEELVWDLVTNEGGRLVKLIGDEAMLVIEDPARACDVALGLIDTSPHAVRVGLAHGTVVALYGDYYGETVNLAARLVAAAEPSTVAVSDSVRRLAGDAFTFAALPARSLKGFGDPVVFHQASRR
jgi:class 3 adenylate cyclase